MSLRQYAYLYWQFCKQHLKVMMEYRVDFLIGVLSVFLVQGSGIIFVTVIFDHIESLHGWTFYEILFIFGIAQTGRALEFLFFDNLWVLGMHYIRPGQFDRLLIRPINPLFHLIADRLQQDGLGQLLIGLIVLGTATSHLDIAWGIGSVLLLIVMIISSAAIFASVNLFTTSLSFWMTDSIPVMFAVHNLNDFARYPLSIYHKSVRMLLTWVIPFGFSAFYPATMFIDRGGYENVALWTPVAAAISCFVAYQMWKRGLKAFVGTGS